ncbi:hypothetical protein LPE509_00666 [Legionella pneumophila subsp. pneumophila LPE509]|nr:hypothetical protein LPE509_00666 [Legionella pneumophila subsp. pneumophila LPE509]
MTSIGVRIISWYLKGVNNKHHIISQHEIKKRLDVFNIF